MTQSLDESGNDMGSYSLSSDRNPTPSTAPNNTELDSSANAEFRDLLRKEFERRDNILAGVNLACTRLIRSTKWQTDITEILRLLGESSNSERVGVISLYKNQQNRLTGSVLYVWDAYGIDLLSQPHLHDFDLEQWGFMPLVDRFNNGEAYYFHRSERDEKQILAVDTQTSLNIPIFSNGELWGVLNFSMTSAERQWTAPEINALQIAADMLSAIIERQQIDEVRKQSEERLAQAVRLARIGVWEWNAVTDDVVWNDEMFRIYGLSRDNFTGKGRDVVQFTREDYRDEQIRSIQSGFASGITLRELSQAAVINTDPQEFVLVGADGQERSVIGDSISIVDENGKPLRMLGITVDVTERKQVEAALIERNRLELALQKELEINDLKTRIMRMMAHEFRTPLAVILSSTSMLKRYSDRMSPEQRTSRLDTIETQVKHLDGLLRESAAVVYEFNEPQGLDLHECDLDAVCRASFAEIQHTIGGNHQMQFSSDGQLTNVHADERLIHRILINLMSNAVKYSPPGTEIQLRLFREGELAVIEVEDHGFGISEEDQQHLYDPFFRASSVQDIEGTGLGLSIVRDSALQHHGTISVRSEVGKGSCFTVKLSVTPEAFA